MNKSLRQHLMLVTVALMGCASTTERLDLPTLQTVPHVELERYLGTWYEIASFPQRFQAGCTATTATYTLRDDGDIDVVNRCRKDTLSGEESVAHGSARVVDHEPNAKLQVSFFGPFWGDYWVIDLAPNYDYAVVGHPGRDYLWILSRTRQMQPETYAAVIERLKAQHYDVTGLVKTEQPTH